VAHAGEVKGVVGENLRKALDWLPTGRTLLTVKTDVHLPFEIESLVQGEPDKAKLAALYERFGFRGMREALLKGEDGEAPAAKSETPRQAPASHVHAQSPSSATFNATRHYETILDEAGLARWIAKLEASPLACFDTETTSLDPMAAQLVGLSFCVQAGEACYVPLAHRYPGAPDQLDREAVLERLRPWFESAERRKVGQNAKYDRHVLANHGIDVKGVVHDTLLASYVLESHQRHDMDSLAMRHLGAKTILYEEVAGKGASSIGFDQVSVERATEYSAEDSDVTFQLHGALWPRIDSDAKLRHIYADIEMPVSGVLLAMERNGVLIDSALLATQGNELGGKMMELERKA
ncbi:MAG: DNA polymerase I, partial [Burkholderiales bacterium]|nr:DNA polymerase I [Burkholderiales bacterium]